MFISSLGVSITHFGLLVSLQKPYPSRISVKKHGTYSTVFMLKESAEIKIIMQSSWMSLQTIESWPSVTDMS